MLLSHLSCTSASVLTAFMGAADRHSNEHPDQQMRASWQAGDNTAALTAHSSPTLELNVPVINSRGQTSPESQPLRQSLPQFTSQDAAEASAGQAAARLSHVAADLPTAAAAAAAPDAVSPGYALHKRGPHLHVSHCCYQLTLELACDSWVGVRELPYWQS